MADVQRYDYSTFQATKTDEGFLVDSPIVARIGIQEYHDATGNIRRELRLPEEVFHPDSLASMRGKPITVEHPRTGKVTSKDAHRVTVGAMLAEGRQDGDHVRTDITIHSPDAIGDRRELSLGYTATLDETPGEHPQFGRYDAIQRNIRVNHLSVVKRGRAGVARLNMDSDEVFINQQEQQTMTVKVKLDNGIEYDAAPEVAAELAKLRADASGFAEKLSAIPKLEAERDTYKARVDGIENELKAAREQGRADAAARIELETVAGKFKIDCKDKTDRQVKESVILAVRKDAVLAEKSDEYINAAFDMAVEAAPAAAIASQRKDALTVNDGAKPTSGADAHKTYLDALKDKHAKEHN